MKVIGTNRKIKVNSSNADFIKSYLEKRKMGVPYRKAPEFDTVPPVNPDLAPELYNMYPLMYDIPTVTLPFGEEEAIDYFTDEAIARRALKQRYAESGFRDNAVSGAGAQGAYQIMPITYQDYLGRGMGKAGDLNDPNYNRKVRDWVMKIIPRDLGEFYSEDDAPLAKLAKLYGAYNWGAGNMRKYLRKQRDNGVDIANDTSWVEGLNPETRRYIKYLAFDEDIPDSTYTNDAFVEAATKKGYLADGGKIHIKPENRGKFTALKERTGHSASWFKENGTPAQKKMAVFALNARKWNHADGGLLHQYDEGGDTEEKRPWWSWAVRVPNMTGTATAAATALRDIPLTDSTVGKELGVAATGLAAIAGPAAINWLSSPANQILFGKFAMPMLGAGFLDQGFKKYTPWKSWGDALVNGTGLGEVMDYALLPQAQQNLVREGAEFTNPAFFAPYEQIGKAVPQFAKGLSDRISGLYNRGMGYLRDIRKPRIEVPYEPADAFAVDLSPDPKGGYIETTATVEAGPSAGQLPAVGDGNTPTLTEYLRSMGMSESRAESAAENSIRSRSSLPREEIEQIADMFGARQQEAAAAEPIPYLNERANRMLGRAESQESLPEIEVGTPSTVAAQVPSRRPITELTDAELHGASMNSRLFGASEYSFDEIAAETERRAAAASESVRGMSMDELRDLRQNMEWNDSRHDAVNYEIRNRMRRQYNIAPDTDVLGLSNGQLADIAGNYRLNDVNSGLFQDNPQYIDTRRIRQEAENELRARVSNLEIPSSFSNLDEAADVYRMIDKAGWNFNYKKDDLMKAVSPDLKRAIVMGEDIPEVFRGRIDGLIEQMIDSDRIKAGSRWFDDWAKRKANDFATMDVDSLRASVKNIVGGASDKSSDAVQALKNSNILKEEVVQPDGTVKKVSRSLGELLDMVRHPEKLSDEMRAEVDRIVKSAYGKPEPSWRSPTTSKSIRNSLLEEEIRKRLPEDVRDKFSLSVIGNPYDKDYPEVAAAVRDKLGFNILPGDIEHLYWFQVDEAIKHGTSVQDAKNMVALQAEMLQRGMPRQTAIAENNRSPQSLLNSIRGATRSPLGYGKNPGQTSLVEQPYHTLERGNSAQTRKILFDANGNMTIGEPTPGAEENFFTKDEFEEFLKAYSDSGVNIEAALKSNPKFVELTDKLIRLSRAMNAADWKPVDVAIGNINRLYGESLSRPTQSIIARTSDTPGFWSANNISDIETLWGRFREGQKPSLRSSGIQGYAPYLYRVPTITLKHKYGGLIQRHSPDNIRKAIMKVRAGQK